MKIFDNNVSAIENTKSVSFEDGGKKLSKSTGPKRASKKNKPLNEKKNISADEIKEKLAANVELSNTGKQKIIEKNKQKLGSGFMSDQIPLKKAETVPAEVEVTSEENTDPNFKDHLVKSDVGLNSPTDVTTTEKLKSVLSKGAFNFNSKEREALEKILS
jgi:hypothetical protein